MLSSEQSLARLEQVLDSLNEGVITADREGNFKTMNAAAMKIFGFRPADQTPRSFSEQVALIEPTDLSGTPLPQAECPIFRAIRGERVRDCQLRIVRKD